ncbi:MAG: rhomboid family intramembrane serine protease [Sedimentisphaerales bacterium]|jgi:membrane associated rhomboid family serine protease
MGLYDRDYTQQENDSHSPYSPQMQLGLPQLTPAVKWLLITNAAVYLVNILISGPEGTGLTLFQRVLVLIPVSPFGTLQLWRFITYQFVHWDLSHIFFNMLGLFFLGPPLEKQWGSRKFLVFYLSCGVAGGLFYCFLVAVGFLAAGPMAGASGAVLAVLTACAILFPQFIVFILFFPVPIRVAAILLICLASVTILSQGANAGGEACHLAGIAAGAAYVLTDSWRTALKFRFKSKRWEKQFEAERRLRIEVDRVLRKVHESGLHSLTASEKRVLKKATRLEQSRPKP